jgi:small subunit ribosomal protein S20
MPHTRSAEKSLRQDEKRRQRNRAAKKAIKTQIKSFLGAVGSDGAAVELKAAIRKLDKAAAKRVIHPNAAARKKSQLARMLAAKK